MSVLEEMLEMLKSDELSNSAKVVRAIDLVQTALREDELAKKGNSVQKQSKGRPEPVLG